MVNSYEQDPIFLRQLLRGAFRLFVRQSAGKGHYEVERKFASSAEEAKQLPARLKGMGFVFAGTACMSDTFLPAAIEGEMERVRRERIGKQRAKTILTFKQWVQIGNGRERKESERTTHPLVALIYLVAGRVVQGSPLLNFSKERQLYDGKLNGSDCVVSVDEVSGLGQYSGWYVEIEVIVPLDGQTSQWEKHIYELAAQLLGADREPEKRSYQDMLKLSRAQ